MPGCLSSWRHSQQWQRQHSWYRASRKGACWRLCMLSHLWRSHRGRALEGTGLCAPSGCSGLWRACCSACLVSLQQQCWHRGRVLMGAGLVESVPAKTLNEMMIRKGSRGRVHSHQQQKQGRVCTQMFTGRAGKAKSTYRHTC